MRIMTVSLSVVHCEGVNTDSLGNYLSGIGLLAALTKKWPSVRAAWRTGHLILVGQDLTLASVEQYLLSDWQRTPYGRWWSVAQKQDTNAKTSMNLRRERNCRSNTEVRLLDAHIVGTTRNHFNPLLGTGGNIAKRDLAKLLKDADSLIRRKAAEAMTWLESTLSGDTAASLPDLSGAGTWFVFANKSFNNGQSWYREGRISPWSVLLAVEGCLVLTGGVNRRLGANSRPYAVFPFISEPSRPTVDGEVGASVAEFWAPMWERPATITEVRTLFQRGMARLGNRSAKAPHEFAIAARTAGVDVGVAEFVRYELRHTTSSQVYESIPRQRIQVGRDRTETKSRSRAPNDADLIMPLIESGWLDRLPYEPLDTKQKGKFVGLRGSVETAIIDIAEKPDDPQRWQNLLQLLATTQFRIDRNRSWRERCAALPLLHPTWFLRAWPQQAPEEVRVAQSVASIGSGTDDSILMNVFGVQNEKYGRLSFPKSRPNRAVWNSGDPVRLLIEIIHRRLIDVNPTDEVPLHAACPCPAELANGFIAGALDIDMIARWVPPLVLIEWSKASHSSNRDAEYCSALDGTALLHALFRPFFHPGPIYIQREPLFAKDRRPHAGLARHLYNLLRYERIDEAVQSAWNAYRAVGRTILRPQLNFQIDGNRITAALLIPMMHREIASGIQRWLEPAKTSPN
jgi:CRISPR-associated protein Csx17